MSTAPQIKGWCPGALRPMLSGDGWVVRVRPRAGRLTQKQAMGIADAARHFGNGILDLSSRANIQIRGVTEGQHGALIDVLRGLDVIDDSVAQEQRRNVLVSPFASDDDLAIAQAIENAMIKRTAPKLPGKFGFAVDCGMVPVLQGAPADIRIERDRNGTLILCADGAQKAKRTTGETAVSEALELARYFAENGGITDGRGRMNAFVREGHALPFGPDVARQQSCGRQLPKLHDNGALVGLAFGQLDAATLTAMARLGSLRLTPWRMVLIEGLKAMPNLPGVIATADDPLLRVVACTGAPGCTQALGDTRRLARILAPLIPQGATVHVSGCAKGCAHPRPAPTTIVATQNGYDMIKNGSASATPDHITLTPEQLGKMI